MAESTVPREAAAPGPTEAASSSPAPGGVALEAASAAMDVDATTCPGSSQPTRPRGMLRHRKAVLKCVLINSVALSAHGESCDF